MVPTAGIYSIQFRFRLPQLHQHLHPHSTCHLSSKTYPLAPDLHWHQYLHLCNLHWIQDSSNLYKKLVPCGTDGWLLLSGFQALVTLTLTLDRVIRHTIVMKLYLHLKCHCNWKNFFLDGLSAGTRRSSRSRDTKIRINNKNLAGSNLDIVL